MKRTEKERRKLSNIWFIASSIVALIVIITAFMTGVP